jgi:hypothetical protein
LYEPNSDFHENTIGHTECQHFLMSFIPNLKKISHDPSLTLF